MIEKEQWPPIWISSRYHVWGPALEAILKPSSEAQDSFWITSRTRDDIGQFSEGHINKAIPSFRKRNRSTEYV